MVILHGFSITMVISYSFSIAMVNSHGISIAMVILHVFIIAMGISHSFCIAMAISTGVEGVDGTLAPSVLLGGGSWGFVIILVMNSNDHKRTM